MQLVHQYLLKGSGLPFPSHVGQSASPQAQQGSILRAEQGQTAGASLTCKSKRKDLYSKIALALKTTYIKSHKIAPSQAKKKVQ